MNSLKGISFSFSCVQFNEAIHESCHDSPNRQTMKVTCDVHAHYAYLYTHIYIYTHVQLRRRTKIISNYQTQARLCELSLI